MSAKDNHLKNLLQLNFAMIFMSTSGPLGRFVDMPPPVIIWWRCLLGATFLFIFCRWRKIDLRINLPHDGFAFLIGGFLLGAHWITYFYALKMSNVAIGMLSLFTYPVITAFLEPILLKTKFQTTHLWLATLVLLGIYLLAPEFALDNDVTVGILFGLISSLLYTLRNILLKKKVERYAGSTLMFYQLVIVTLFLWPAFFIFDISTITTEWPTALALGLITTAIGHTSFVVSFKNFSVSTASIISSTQPIYGIVLGFFFLHEIPHWNTIVGGALILATVLIESLRSNKKE